MVAALLPARRSDRTKAEALSHPSGSGKPEPTHQLRRLSQAGTVCSGWQVAR